ncbi:unnamed protein product, partial [Didymodactylos carnosus]
KMFQKYVTAGYKKFLGNENDENDAESATNSQSRRFLLGQYFEQLNEIVPHHIEDHDRNFWENDLDQIGQNVFDLHDQLNQIQSAEDQKIENNCQYFNDRLNASTHSQDNNETNLDIQLACYSTSLEEKLNDMKNIFYKRYKTKFEELIQNMKLKYEKEFENYRKMNNLKSELEEYSKYCNEKLIVNQVEVNDYQITEFTVEKDAKCEELKSKWLLTNDFDFYSEYETYVLNMKDSIIKSRHLFEISQIYNAKQPTLNVYLEKSIEFLNKSIAMDEFRIHLSNFDLHKTSNLRTDIRSKFELLR